MREQISVFDMIKIGIGPSSSHTMGPWRAAALALDELRAADQLDDVTHVDIDLYGSLAKTGSGHGTHTAVLLGLSGEDYLTTDTSTVRERAFALREAGRLRLAGRQSIPFRLRHFADPLPFHPNGMRFIFHLQGGAVYATTFYSIGGGFVVKEGQPVQDERSPLPYPVQSAADLLAHCRALNTSIAGVVGENERAWRSPLEIDAGLTAIWETMRAAVYRGCQTPGVLPGGLNVKRRAPDLARKLLGGAEPQGLAAWLDALQAQAPFFDKTLKWVSCFALATNEENAAFGRIVTAPTNGACGVIPAVLMYHVYLSGRGSEDDAPRFLLVAGEIGSIFKKGATISAAMGGCQAEIGVSSAMAAGALTECLGGSVEQALMAAEIAMEHHLGMTCDPIGGLVQIPCIERNSMGAVKAITAAHIALESDPAAAKVSLDAVIQAMWDTARDMHSKYKETAEGGLAAHIPVNVIEC